VSNLGVDLLRSDTGHYMEWPVDEAPVAASPPPANRGRSWRAAAGLGGPVSADDDPTVVLISGPFSVQVAAAPDRTTMSVVLLNWAILLLMFCAFLLAVTLPSADLASTDSPFSPTCSGQDCAVSATAAR
jgi:hypothetical protein